MSINIAMGVETAAGSGSFPPFDTTTFPNQFFWLAITFTFLFVVLWRIAGPRIGGAIGARKSQIEGDLTKAETHKKDAEAAQAAYEKALADARGRAHALAEENRKKVNAEIETAKAKAEADAAKTMADADARIQSTRKDALAHVAKAAEETVVAIVAHLTGDTVSPEEARGALRPFN